MNSSVVYINRAFVAGNRHCSGLALCWLFAVFLGLGAFFLPSTALGDLVPLFGAYGPAFGVLLVAFGVRVRQGSGARCGSTSPLWGRRSGRASRVEGA